MSSVASQSVVAFFDALLQNCSQLRNDATRATHSATSVRFIAHVHVHACTCALPQAENNSDAGGGTRGETNKESKATVYRKEAEDEFSQISIQLHAIIVVISIVVQFIFLIACIVIECDISFEPIDNRCFDLPTSMC